MGKRRSLLDYLKRAFQTWPNYGLLLAVSVLAVLTRQPGWLAIGGGLELVYLYMLAFNPRFQNVVDSELGDREQLDLEPIKARILPALDDGLRQRYEKLEALTADVRRPASASVLKRDPYLLDNQRKVATLLVSFLRIAFALTRYAQYMSGNDAAKVGADIKQLTAECESATDERVRQVKQKNIEVLKQRQSRIAKAAANRDYLTAQLRTIEDTLQLVVDQAVTLSDPKGAGLQVDTLLQNLQDSDQLTAEMGSLLDLDLGDDNLDDLPPLPARSAQKQ